MEGWTEDESQELLQKILNVSGDIKNKSFKFVETAMDWDSLKIDNKSGEDCKLMYQNLISKVRKYRTMCEIITDAMDNLKQGGLKIDSKMHPDYPKKPINAYSLYVKKKAKKYSGMSFVERSAVLSQEWKDLPEEKKEVYRQKYLKNKEKYKQEVELFVQNHPQVKKSTNAKNPTKPQVPVPSRLYQEAKLQKILQKNPELTNAEASKKCQTRYQALSDKRKLVWIKRAQEAMKAYRDDCLAYSDRHPNFKPAEFHLTKEEKKILDDFYGKPAPPPKNFFLYFIEVNKDKLSHIPFADRSKYTSVIYRTIPEEELKELTENYIKMMKDYIDQYVAFYSNLPDEERSKHESPETASKAYKAALKAEVLKEKRKNNKVQGTALKRSHETESPDVAYKKKKTDLPNTTSNISNNVSSTETNNASSTTPKQKKKNRNPTE